MSASSKFVMFQRGDGSIVACQTDRILFVSRGDHGTVINFGGATQLNVREEFDDVIAKLDGCAQPAPDFAPEAQLAALPRR
jgi:hypothetical protein